MFISDSFFTIVAQGLNDIPRTRFCGSSNKIDLAPCIKPAFPSSKSRLELWKATSYISNVLVIFGGSFKGFKFFKFLYFCNLSSPTESKTSGLPWVCHTWEGHWQWLGLWLRGRRLVSWRQRCCGSRSTLVTGQRDRAGADNDPFSRV